MIVVTGATGNVGRALVQALHPAGEAIVATARGVSAANVPPGVRHTQADLTDAPSLKRVFDGADALFLQSGGASAALLDPRAILGAAQEAGITRVVLLSSQGVRTRGESVSHGGVMRYIEDAVLDSGLAWTILRPGGFNSNSYAWAESVRKQRTIAAPFGDVGLPTIDPVDIALVAAESLRGDLHSGQVYELTGPAVVTPRQQATAIGEALGEPVRFVELSREEALAQMVHYMPEDVGQTTLDVLGTPTSAEQRISPDVESVLGRAPSGFSEWAMRNIAVFR